MAIINSIEITEGEKTFNRITSSNPYFAIGYNLTLNVILMTEFNEEEENDGAIEGNTVTDNVYLEGFGADTYQELIDEANNRGLIFPVQ